MLVLKGRRLRNTLLTRT